MKKRMPILTILSTVIFALSFLLISCDGGEVNISVSGMVAPGDCLTLKHNLGRDNITFTAQFTKDGIVYGYREYAHIFGVEGELMVEPT